MEPKNTSVRSREMFFESRSSRSMLRNRSQFQHVYVHLSFGSTNEHNDLPASAKDISFDASVTFDALNAAIVRISALFRYFCIAGRVKFRVSTFRLRLVEGSKRRAGSIESNLRNQRTVEILTEITPVACKSRNCSIRNSKK